MTNQPRKRLNKFKEVNDTLGHPVGDSLLKSVAERLKSCVRGDDVVARLGGDEFGVVVHTFDPATEAAAVAARVHAALTAPFVLGEHQIRISTSIGIAVPSGDADEPDELIRQADVALYRAKADGGDRCRFFDLEMGQPTTEQRPAA